MRQKKPRLSYTTHIRQEPPATGGQITMTGHTIQFGSQCITFQDPPDLAYMTDLDLETWRARIEQSDLNIPIDVGVTNASGF